MPSERSIFDVKEIQQFFDTPSSCRTSVFAEKSTATVVEFKLCDRFKQQRDLGHYLPDDARTSDLFKCNDKFLNEYFDRFVLIDQPFLAIVATKGQQKRYKRKRANLIS